MRIGVRIFPHFGAQKSKSKGCNAVMAEDVLTWLRLRLVAQIESLLETRLKVLFSGKSRLIWIKCSTFSRGAPRCGSMDRTESTKYRNDAMNRQGPKQFSIVWPALTFIKQMVVIAGVANPTARLLPALAKAKAKSRGRPANQQLQANVSLRDQACERLQWQHDRLRPPISNSAS